ncbi:MAG: 30S ribosomal protein S6 [Deltaproteobacteria bacterium]|jgi:small subunit ribosomal protein S6|nr:30S ribosomal protein S6 [Deltaproteobacteria bacterium]
MRRYETIVIVDPDLGEEQRGVVFDKIRELIPQKGGLLVEFDEWGGRKLAYEIKKKQRGYYVRIDYCGGGDLVSEMERQFRIDDRVMKYMTILLDTEADMERIQEAMTQAEQEAEAAAAASESADPPETATEAVAEAAPVETEPETSPEPTESEAKKEEA